MAFNPDFLNCEIDENQPNQLLQYLQHQPPEILAKVAQSATPEIRQIIAQNVQGLLGVLPSSHFHIQIMTDKDNLDHLLSSAMMTGYFLRQMEQRMELDTAFNEQFFN
jgi:putative heme iron utilization protein